MSLPAPYYDRDGITLYRGDCRAVLAALPADSVSACVTSPPYWGLRKYEVAPTIWGGDPACSHRWDVSSKAQPIAFAPQDKGRSASIHETAESSGISDSKPDAPSSLATRDPGNKAGVTKVGTEVVDEEGAGAGEADAMGLVNPPVAVKETSNEIPGQSCRQSSRPSEAQRLARMNAYSDQPIDRITGIELNLRVSAGGTPEAFSNERQESGIPITETNGTIISDVTIRGEKAEQVGTPSVPMIKDREAAPPVGHTPAGERTEANGGRASDSPSRYVVGSATDLAAEVASSLAHNSMICQKCGAFKGHYGCEPSVAMYVEHTIEVLRAIRRMLRPDGVLWWDLDDSRSGTNDRASFRPGAGRADGKVDSRGQRNRDGSPSSGLPPPKSLCLIPQRIAIAAADDGWTVRSQIVIAAWMPESAKDRPTDSYRVLLMLTRSKKYWYDGWAVRVTAARDFQDYERHTDQGQEARGGRLGVFTDGSYSNQGSPDGLRKLGNCWTDIPPAAHPSSPSFRHFAVMPIAEAERAILASVPEAICTKCGKPRVRMVKTKAMVIDRSDGAAASGIRTLPSGTMVEAPQAEAVGWTTCDCGAPFEPGAVLDCFAGTGTTGVAAQKLGRKAILIELSDDYCRQAVTRLTVGDKGIRTLAAAENAGAEQGRML